MLHTLVIFHSLLLVGPLIGASCAILSVYIVLRRMALIPEAISHAGYGGIAVAIAVGAFVGSITGPNWQEIITGIFCLITALLIGYVTGKKRVTEDSAIGIFLVASVAFGQLLLSAIRVRLQSHGGRLPANVEDLLFGDFISANDTDLLIVGISLAVVAAIIGSMYFQFLYTTLDEEMARINGVSTRLVNFLLLLMVSTVTVVCVRMVGFLMITALMIIPGATANMLSRKFGGVLVISILIGTLGTSAATWLMIVPPFDQYSSGPLVVLLLFGVFGVVWLYRQFKPKPGAVEASPVRSAPGAHAAELPASGGRNA